ncbi:hypothetical protein ABFS83_01G052300 [Erythranthe nasuta]
MIRFTFALSSTLFLSLTHIQTSFVLKERIVFSVNSINDVVSEAIVIHLPCRFTQMLNRRRGFLFVNLLQDMLSSFTKSIPRCRIVAKGVKGQLQQLNQDFSHS